MSATATRTRTARRFHVYVIELDPAVLGRKRFREANPERDPEMPCVYVGQTSKTPATRFEQHRSGYKSCPLARDFGRRLLSGLGGTLPSGATREDAEREEARLGRELRGLGYAVWWR